MRADRCIKSATAKWTEMGLFNTLPLAAAAEQTLSDNGTCMQCWTTSRATTTTSTCIYHTRRWPNRPNETPSATERRLRVGPVLVSPPGQTLHCVTEPKAPNTCRQPTARMREEHGCMNNEDTIFALRILGGIRTQPRSPRYSAADESTGSRSRHRPNPTRGRYDNNVVGPRPQRRADIAR